MTAILRALKLLFGMLFDSALRLILSIAAAIAVIALMVAATLWFGTTGLLIVAVPLVIGLFIIGFVHAGGDDDA